MTGFARVEAAIASTRWVWEIKSVNGKGLDVRCKLPNGLEFFEKELRKSVSEKMTRGNLQVNLAFASDDSSQLPKLDLVALDAVLNIVETIGNKANLAPASIDGILAVKGVVTVGEKDSLNEEATAIRNAALSKSFKEAVAELANARLVEGASIQKVLTAQIDEIARLTKLIDQDASRTPDAIKKSLKEKLDKILEQSADLDEQRLAQEVAILATKADLQEELDRLKTHIESAYELLISDEPVGRKLDFLSQEFNRECNTVCSKSNASSVTQLGLEMKVVIDQFKEQIQNIQ